MELGRYIHQRKSLACFVTLVERASRYYIAIPVSDRKQETVTRAIIENLGFLPSELVKTITFDRGKEFAGFKEIEEKLECNTYFCDPYCAWQKGSKENGNGLLREFYSKGMDLSLVDDAHLKDQFYLLLDETDREMAEMRLQNWIRDAKESGLKEFRECVTIY